MRAPKKKAGARKASASIAQPAAPSRPLESVAILGLGPSLEAYADITKRLGARRAMFDEVWGINSAIDVFNCDRGLHMDDVRVQEIRAAAKPRSNIAAMLPWLRKHPGPIYTSVPHPDYPGLVPYPLEDVMNSCGRVGYFNSTGAYAVALAVHLRVKKIYLFGIDYSFKASHSAEKGRGNVEFFLGMHRARGGVIGLPDGTTLMDGVATKQERLYGYDGMDVEFEGDEDEPLRVKFTPRDLPTAEEIEARYDHDKPTVPPELLRKS